MPFNKEQLEFINSGISAKKIIGNPGCGKTSTIIEHISSLFDRKLLSNPSEFLILTFSRKACNDFITRGQSKGTLFNKNNVRTIHSLATKVYSELTEKTCSSIKTVIIACHRLIQDKYTKNSHEPTVIKDSQGRMTDADEDANEDNQSDDWPQDVEEFGKNIRVGILEHIKYILVDEAQDLSESQYNLIMQIAENLDAPVCMIGDACQNLYSFAGSSDEFLRNHEGTEIVLTKNYRSTVEIVEFANYFKRWKHYPKMISGNKTHGPKPTIHGIHSHDICEYIEKLIVAAINSGIEPSDIAILSPVKKSREIDAGEYQNFGLSLLENYFARKRIQFVKFYSDENKEEFELAKDVHREKGKINLCTNHASKGLEWKYVIVLNFHLKTFGMQPTEDDYIAYQYLWYVALSRAAYKMDIIVDSAKDAWPILSTVPVNLYDVIGTEPTFPQTLTYRTPSNQLQYSVTEFMQKLNDHQTYAFEELIGYDGRVEHNFDEISDKLNDSADILSYVRNGHVDDNDVEHMGSNETFIEVTRLYDVPNNLTLVDRKTFGALYGMVIEEIFNYYVAIKNNTLDLYITNKLNLAKNTIIIPQSLAKSYNKFVSKIGKATLENVSGVKISIIRKNKNHIDEPKILDFIETAIERKGIDDDDRIRIFLESELKFINAEYINDLIQGLSPKELKPTKLKNDEVENYGFDDDDAMSIMSGMTSSTRTFEKDNICKQIFDIMLYYYQISEEKKYFLELDFTKHIAALEPYVLRIRRFVMSMKRSDTKKFHLQNQLFHDNLPMVAVPDILCKTKIVDLKFVRSIDIHHIGQMILYGLIRYAPIMSAKLWNLELWNLQDGYCYTIHVNPKLNLMDLNIFISKTIKHKIKYSAFILDLETSGINSSICEPIEISVREYFYNYKFLNTLIKPQNRISKKITEITGITNTELEQYGIDYEDFKSKFNKIYTHFQDPIFIAHNGNSFDFKIMKRIGLIPEEYQFLVDSKTVIGQFYNEKNVYKEKETKLVQLYKLIVNKTIKNAHRADADVRMLREIFIKLEVSRDELLGLIG